MSDVYVSLIIAAGVAAFAYTKLGRRVGYGNTAKVWETVAITYIFSFGVVFSFIKLVLKVNV